MCGDKRIDMGALCMPTRTSSINWALVHDNIKGTAAAEPSTVLAGGISSGKTEFIKLISWAGLWIELAIFSVSKVWSV